MDDKSVAFVGKALDCIKSNPEFTPNFVDTVELAKDYKVFNVLNEFLRPLAQITDPDKGVDRRFFNPKNCC